jgi:hypothetical protein
LVARPKTDKVHRFLLDPLGAHYIGWQHSGSWLFDGYHHVGQSHFSSDGTKYARIEAEGDEFVSDTIGHALHLWDFDRCTGLLSNAKTRRFFRANFKYFVGVEFSPDSRLLYAVTDSFVVQFDTNLGNQVFQYPDTVGRSTFRLVTPFVPEVTSVFNMAQLAPDGKIYMSSYSGFYLHVIDHPNVRGVGCNVREWGYPLGRINAWSIPNYPVYRLGRLEGSACDTIYNSVAEIGEGGMRIYPNPTSSHINIEWEEALQPTHLIVRDILGREILSLPIAHQINLDVLQNGMYFVSIYKNEVVLCVKKVVVQR